MYIWHPGCFPFGVGTEGLLGYFGVGPTWVPRPQTRNPAQNGSGSAPVFANLTRHL